MWNTDVLDEILDGTRVIQWLEEVPLALVRRQKIIEFLVKTDRDLSWHR